MHAGFRGMQLIIGSQDLLFFLPSPSLICWLCFLLLLSRLRLSLSSYQDSCSRSHLITSNAWKEYLFLKSSRPHKICNCLIGRTTCLSFSQSLWLRNGKAVNGKETIGESLWSFSRNGISSLELGAMRGTVGFTNNDPTLISEMSTGWSIIFLPVIGNFYVQNCLLKGECLNLNITKISYYFIFRHRLKLSLTFVSSYMYHKSDFANIPFSVIIYQ